MLLKEIYKETSLLDDDVHMSISALDEYVTMGYAEREGKERAVLLILIAMLVSLADETQDLLMKPHVKFQLNWTNIVMKIMIARWIRLVDIWLQQNYHKDENDVYPSLTIKLGQLLDSVALLIQWHQWCGMGMFVIADLQFEQLWTQVNAQILQVSNLMQQLLLHLTAAMLLTPQNGALTYSTLQ